MPMWNNPTEDKSLERLQEATKRGAEVLPATISGSTAEQAPLAVIPANPAVVPIDTAGTSQPEAVPPSD